MRLGGLKANSGVEDGSHSSGRALQTTNEAKEKAKGKNEKTRVF
jgi:hypothetical protein